MTEASSITDMIEVRNDVVSAKARNVSLSDTAAERLNHTIIHL